VTLEAHRAKSTCRTLCRRCTARSTRRRCWRARCGLARWPPPCWGAACRTAPPQPQPWMVRLRVRVSHETLTCAKRRRYTTSLPSSASPAGGPSGFSKSGDHRSAMLAAFNVQPPYPKYLCGCQSAPTWSVHEPPPPPDRNHDDAPLPPLPLPLLLPPPLPPRLCRPPRSTHGWRSYVRPMAGTDQESGD
jgi:hypothetical protein